MPLLSLFLGAIMGLSLGLTGGGGSILAVPTLKYLMHLDTAQATTVSLAAVCATAIAGAVQRIARREVEIKTGLFFAAAGMASAPLGAWLHHQLPETVVLLGFAALMVYIAVRMWRKASSRPGDAGVVRSVTGPRMEFAPTVACRRDPEGILRLNSRCMMLLGLLGIVTGILSGLFGVGGGFVIVPALVFFTGMSIHHAVATSLMVIALITGVSFATNLAAGPDIPSFRLAGLFVCGGLIGMFAGSLVGRAISPARLQRVFAVIILLIAAFVILKSTVLKG